MAAMRKVFRKYNFVVKEDFMAKEGFIGQTKQGKKNTTAAATASTNQTGSRLPCTEFLTDSH
jgi:hypothetical protein